MKFSTGKASGILKLKQEGEIPIEDFCKLLVSQIKTAEEGFEVENLASRKRSPIHRKRKILSLAFKNHQIQASGTSWNLWE